MARWFRHYCGLSRDEKLVSTAVKSGQSVERVVWVFGAILESACEIQDDGRYDFDAGEAAYFLRCNDADIQSILDELEAIGRLHQGVVAKWGDRLFLSDSSRERQRRYRELRNDAKIHQGNGHKADSDVTKTSRDAEVTLQDTDTEVKKEDTSVSSKKDSQSSKTRGSRLSEDWQPLPELISWAMTELLLDAGHIRGQTERFVDYWLSQPGQKGVKVRWDLTWKNWMRKARDDKRASAVRGNQRASDVESYKRKAAGILEDVRGHNREIDDARSGVGRHRSDERDGQRGSVENVTPRLVAISGGSNSDSD